jgi:hypothetical protein
MLKLRWGQVVYSLLIGLRQSSDLSATSTVRPKYLTNQVFLRRCLYTTSKQLGERFTHFKIGVFNQLNQILYPVSTVPTTNTNLIKDLY